MGDFFPDYRDPIFSVIVLFAIVFIIAFVNYWWGAFKSKEEKDSIKRFIKKFEMAENKEAYKKLLNEFQISTESLGLLAHSYSKSGDFETAIEIYLIALKQVKTRIKKIHILSELGKVYFKAGFLKRSIEVFLESLGISPRDRVSLKYLAVCFERLKEYDNALDTLDSLDELGVDTEDEKSYILAKKVLNDTSLSLDQKKVKLLSMSEFPFAQRLLLEQYQKEGALVTKELLSSIKPELIFDIAWSLDENILPHDNSLYHKIAQARGVTKVENQSMIFELEVLSRLQEVGYKKATLTFEFTCKECKQTYPMHFYRCPNCHSLSTVAIEPILANRSHEAYIPFQ